MIIQILNDAGEWVEGSPVVGEKVRYVYDDTHAAIMTFADNSSSPESALIPIIITGVDGATTVASDFSKITVPENQIISISGAVAIPDKIFITPIEKQNVTTGEVTTLYKEISVVDGVFTTELTLPVGKYRLTQQLINAELPAPVFSMSDIEIYITI